MKEPTVRELIPQLAIEPVFPFQKASPRYAGTAKLNLRRPSRLPASSRKYLHGDPVHLIDWRAFARNDQLLIRERHDEASTKVLIVLDADDSLQWPPAWLGSGPTKFEIAARMAFHLAFAHLKKGDLVKLVMWEPGKPKPNRAFRILSSSDVLKLFESASTLGFTGDQMVNFLSPARVSEQQHDLTYLLTDGLRSESFAWTFQQSRQVSLIHVLSTLELDLSWLKSDFCYFDEHRQKKEFLGSTLVQSREYQERLREWMEQLDQTCQKNLGRYIKVNDQTTLREYLERVFA
jgi:hypothetical protein